MDRTIDLGSFSINQWGQDWGLLNIWIWCLHRATLLPDWPFGYNLHKYTRSQEAVAVSLAQHALRFPWMCHEGNPKLLQGNGPRKPRSCVKCAGANWRVTTLAPIFFCRIPGSSWHSPLGWHKLHARWPKKVSHRWGASCFGPRGKNDLKIRSSWINIMPDHRLWLMRVDLQNAKASRKIYVGSSRMGSDMNCGIRVT